MVNRVEIPLSSGRSDEFYIERIDSNIKLYKVGEEEPLFSIPDGSNAKLVVEVK